MSRKAKLQKEVLELEKKKLDLEREIFELEKEASQVRRRAPVNKVNNVARQTRSSRKQNLFTSVSFFV